MAKVKRILIGEDEKPMGRALNLKLSSVGYEVDNAYNGEEVLEKLEAGSFDLLLLDLIMPKLNGFAVLEKIKEKKIKVKIIVLSNLSQVEDAQKAKALGASGYFIKSDTPISGIVDEVKKVLK